jgi:predicted dehydrogenase
MLQHRFRPAGMKLREMLRAGELGTIVNCSTVIRLWRPQSYYDVEGRGTRARDGGGVLITQGIHTLDLMLSLSGPIAEVRGYATTSSVHRMETEDLVAAAVKYENGALGVIDATTAAFPGFPERIEIIGEKATASLVGSDLTVAHRDGRVTELKTEFGAGGTGADPMAFPNDWHRGVIADFSCRPKARTDGERPRSPEGASADRRAARGGEDGRNREGGGLNRTASTQSFARTRLPSLRWFDCCCACSPSGTPLYFSTGSNGWRRRWSPRAGSMTRQSPIELT